jgi:O-antigen/teichoic acid export membrane protein
MVWSALTALMVIASALVGLNTNGLVGVQYFRADKEAFRASVGASVGVMAGSAIATALLLVLASDTIATVSGVTPFWQWTVVVAAAGKFALTLAQTVWQVQGFAFRYGCWQVGFSILFLGVTLALVAGVGLGWKGYAIGQAFAAAALGTAGLLVIGQSSMLTLRFTRDHLAQALHFGLPLLPHTLAGVAIANMDRLILSGTVGPSETGMYFVAVQISSILVLFAGAANQAWVPWLFSQLANGSAAARTKVVRATYALFGVFAAATVILVISGSLIVRILTAEQYYAAAELLPLLCPAAALTGMYYLVGGYFIYAKRTASFLLTITAVVKQY